jgi:hypothetical protein
VRKQFTLTFDEHAVLGKELYAIRRVILGKIPFRTMNLFERFRSKLDDQLCLDFPDRFDVHVYYPGPAHVPCQSASGGPGRAVGSQGADLGRGAGGDRKTN